MGCCGSGPRGPMPKENKGESCCGSSSDKQIIDQGNSPIKIESDEDVPAANPPSAGKKALLWVLVAVIIISFLFWML